MKKNLYHKLLKRQINRYLNGIPDALLEQYQEFITAVNDAYYQFDGDLALLGRSMELSSKELIQAIAELRQAEAKIRCQNEYLVTLQEITLRLMNQLNLADVRNLILRDVMAMFGATDVFIGFWEQANNTLCVKVSTGSQQGCIYNHLTRDEEDIIDKTLLQGEVLILNDCYSLPGRILDLSADVIKTVIVVPLKPRGEVVEIMFMVYRDEPRLFEDEMISTLNQFAVVASIALENARLYAVAQEELAVRKRTEEELKHLSMHDSLTGLYNRSYFERTTYRFQDERYAPVGVVICDIDGLKLINDTMGHTAGDQILLVTAEILRRNFRDEDVISRIGGDEFAILLPNCNALTIETIQERIMMGVKKYHDENKLVPLSLSIGYAVSNERLSDFEELFKEADNNMYREKLHRSQSTRSAIVQTMMKTLEARDFITEGHAERMQNLAVEMALAIGLSEHKANDLRLLAQFHDIGKVGIPDRILFKTSPLTHAEKIEMRRHCEIGYRIAQSATDLAPIADGILKHHEWWNGKGYPLGLKGEEIPLECRIIAVVDAFDAMTNARPYRKPIKPQKAINEIKKYAGIQFDPCLVKEFLLIMKNKGIGVDVDIDIDSTAGE